MIQVNNHEDGGVLIGKKYVFIEIFHGSGIMQTLKVDRGRMLFYGSENSIICGHLVH